MYNGNLSFTQTNSYLSLLTSLRLLSQTNSKYETTDKGRQFLSTYNELGRITGMPAPTLTKMQFVRGMKVEEKLGDNSLIIQVKPNEKRSRKRFKSQRPIV
jgi:DNA polymerase elongation subunit (family B)